MRIPGLRKKQRSHLTKAEESSGVMVALYPSPDVATALAQPDGEPVEDLHLTLAYLGDAGGFNDPSGLRAMVEGFATTVPPLKGEISGIGRFTAGPEPVTYASVDIPGLPEFRQSLWEALCTAGFEPSTEHGFTPHITLAYDHRDPEIPNLALAFNAISVAIAGECTDYPLSGKNAAEENPVNDDVTIAHKSEDGRVELTTPLWKDDAKQIVYGTVMQPDVPDSEGDTVSPEEIEQAAHRYLADSRKHDIQHNEQVAEVTPVESFIVPMDMEYAGRPVLKGSWVMAVHVADPEVWQQVTKGELTGFSIGGTAVRED